jgi:RNA polymerase sigma-70 factor (ECF subfamily)
VEIEDPQLVKLVLAGQTDDFRALVDRHQQPIFRFAVKILGSWEAAVDVTQEVFLAAFANLATYDSSRALFSTWLFTIARNRCRNLLQQRQPLPLNELDPIGDVMSTDPIVSQELSQQLSQQLSQKLDRALAALPLEQRSAFVLAEIEELSYDQIARIEQISLGTVKSRIHRAKQRLQSLLEPVLRELQ